MVHEAKPELKYRTYLFSVRLVKYIADLPSERVYWVIGDQLLRSGTSIGANVVEALAASSKRDFAKFFVIALKSANETKYWLALLRDATDVENGEVKEMLIEVEEIANILGASAKTLRRSD